MTCFILRHYMLIIFSAFISPRLIAQQRKQYIN